MKYVIWTMVALLVLLQQDYWQWDDTTLVAGFLPYTLVYHAGISLGAAVLWFMVTKFCWPDALDSIVPENESVAGADSEDQS